MTIEVNNKEPEVMFCSIPQGYPFKNHNDDGMVDYYIKTSTIDVLTSETSEWYNAMKVDTGEMCKFYTDDMVIPVNGKFVVE